ncbi:hypothetical protein PTKIN_Ptkin03bG0188700 [Pterospermum kingtungense]
MSELEFNMTKMLVWVLFKNVPLEFFTQRGLGYIASAMGLPQYMDRFTAERKILEYARICVEVDVTKKISKVIEVVRRNGTVVPVEVMVPLMPGRCLECNHYGHTNKSCPQNSKAVEASKKIWIPKKEQKKEVLMEEIIVSKIDDISIKGKHVVVVQNSPVKQLVQVRPVDLQVDAKETRASSIGVVAVVKACQPRRKGPMNKKAKSGGSPKSEFTWINNQNADFQARKLDRVLVNHEWIAQFPDTMAEFQVLGVSDHSPGVIRRIGDSRQTPKPFKFFNFWAAHPDFEAIVRESWLKEEQGNLIQLEQVQKRLLTGKADEGDVEKEKKLQRDLLDIRKAEESFYRHKSKVLWLQEGDFNTRFFHRIVKVRQKSQQISVLRDAAGNLIDTHDKLVHEVVGFFQALIDTKDARV